MVRSFFSNGVWRVCVSIAGVSSMMLAGIAGGAVIRVNASSPTLGNGSSWGSAMIHLRDALAIAQPGDEIWVATGTYYPDRTGANPIGNSDRTATFRIPAGVSIFGGFNGTETMRSQRSWVTNPTILSGDVGVRGAHGDNSFIVVTAENLSNSSSISGFVIQRGQADNGTGGIVPYSQGGGIFVSGGQGPVISDCKFEDNLARGGAGISINSTTGTQVLRCQFLRGNALNRGGGIEILSTSGALIQDCLFVQNQGYYGGGTYANFASVASVDRCRFERNVSVNGGGMSQAGFSVMTTTNCWFIANECRQLTFYQQSFDGGAIHNWCTASTFTNCLFVGNTAQGRGGVIFDSGPSGSSGKLTNCTMYGNWSRDGGLLASTGDHVTTLKNSIVWATGSGVGSGLSAVFDGSMTFERNNIQGYWNGTNTGWDPGFVDFDGPDNMLATSDDDFRLSGSSPLIDAGDNSFVPSGTTLDILGNARINDGNGDSTDVVDIGAFEYLLPPPPPCYGDANLDRMVSFPDITTILQNWNEAGNYGDANLDGFVSFPDITAVLNRWGIVCPR